MDRLRICRRPPLHRQQRWSHHSSGLRRSKGRPETPPAIRVRIRMSRLIAKGEQYSALRFLKHPARSRIVKRDSEMREDAEANLAADFFAGSAARRDRVRNPCSSNLRDCRWVVGKPSRISREGLSTIRPQCLRGNDLRIMVASIIIAQRFEADCSMTLR
jgi:hypothetical protein